MLRSASQLQEAGAEGARDFPRTQRAQERKKGPKGDQRNSYYNPTAAKEAQGFPDAKDAALLEQDCEASTAQGKQ